MVLMLKVSRSNSHALFSFGLSVRIYRRMFKKQELFPVKPVISVSDSANNLWIVAGILKGDISSIGKKIAEPLYSRKLAAGQRKSLAPSPDARKV
jgi:hypothetical protein